MLKKILNIVFEVLKGLKNVGLFKRGARPEDIVPSRKDPRDKYPRR